MAYAQSDFGETPYKPTGTGPDPTAKKPRGCWFYGCITLVILGVVALLAIGVASYFAYNFAQKVVSEYTSPTPLELPPLTITDEARKSIDERWEAFKTAADKGEPAELMLSAEDLNALISENETMKGTVYLTIEGDQIGGKISFPLDRTGMPMVGGRFLNGDATFTASLENGLLVAHINSIEVNGKTPPPDMQNALKNENILKDVKFDSDMKENLSKIESLTVKDGKIILKSHVKKADGDAKSEEKPVGDMPKEEPAKTEEAPPADTATKDEAKATTPPADAPKVETPTTPPAEAPKEEMPKEEAPKQAA